MCRTGSARLPSRFLDASTTLRDLRRCSRSRRSSDPRGSRVARRALCKTSAPSPGRPAAPPLRRRCRRGAARDHATRRHPRASAYARRPDRPRRAPAPVESRPDASRARLRSTGRRSREDRARAAARSAPWRRSRRRSGSESGRHRDSRAPRPASLPRATAPRFVSRRPPARQPRGRRT